MYDTIQYATWEAHRLAAIVGDKDEPQVEDFITFFNEDRSSHLKEFLDFQIAGYQLAINSNYKISRHNEWKRINDLAQHCLLLRDDKDFDGLAMMMLSLGGAIEKIGSPSLDEQIDLGKYKINHLKSLESNNLININKLRGVTQSIAQQIASDIWSKDSDKSIRSGEMCELIVQRIFEIESLADHEITIYFTRHNKKITEYIPKDWSHIKKWIKNETPDYAKKGGAPKK